MKSEIQQEAQTLIIACTLTQEEQVERGKTNRPVLTSYRKVQELEDGYAFQYPGEPAWIQTLVKFITDERDCCLFFTFELMFEPNLGPIWLSVRGSAEVKDLVRDQWLVQL